MLIQFVSNYLHCGSIRRRYVGSHKDFIVNVRICSASNATGYSRTGLIIYCPPQTRGVKAVKCNCDNCTDRTTSDLASVATGHGEWLFGVWTDSVLPEPLWLDSSKTYIAPTG